MVRMVRGQSLFENYEGACFGAKGHMTRRNEGASLIGAVTEAQRIQMAFCATTLRTAVLLAASVVGSDLTARCGDARSSPPRLPPKSLAAGLLVVFKKALILILVFNGQRAGG